MCDDATADAAGSRCLAPSSCTPELGVLDCDCRCSGARGMCRDTHESIAPWLSPYMLSHRKLTSIPGTRALAPQPTSSAAAPPAFARRRSSDPASMVSCLHVPAPLWLRAQSHSCATPRGSATPARAAAQWVTPCIPLPRAPRRGSLHSRGRWGGLTAAPGASSLDGAAPEGFVEASVATVQLSKETVRASCWGAHAVCKRSNASCKQQHRVTCKELTPSTLRLCLPQGPVIYLRVTTGDSLRGVLLPVFVGTRGPKLGACGPEMSHTGEVSQLARAQARRRATRWRPTCGNSPQADR